VFIGHTEAVSERPNIYESARRLHSATDTALGAGAGQSIDVLGHIGSKPPGGESAQARKHSIDNSRIV